MEEGWESHVSPLMMGVGMGDIDGMGDMPPCGGSNHEIGGEIMSHHQALRSGHAEMVGDLHHDMDREMGTEMGHGMRDHHGNGMGAQHHDYFGQEVSVTVSFEKMNKKINY
ncbi:hypothetical protein HHI36_018489 [Cryptolaemus montrouzieri]|uniref:Uncharacterized protein n=1 Tax=Cryptolaemus montrouzieri TaxID=559131 RepID=A0ABD2P0K1_9CUCU